METADGAHVLALQHILGRAVASKKSALRSQTVFGNMTQ
jgi:hypothetical protein